MKTPVLIKSKRIESIRLLSFNDESIIHFATRYALGRKTSAVSIVCDTLNDRWFSLRLFARDSIQREIREAIGNNEAGDTWDVDQWIKILYLPNKKKKEKIDGKP